MSEPPVGLSVSPNCCVGCGQLLRGHCAARNGRRWHMDCWAKRLEAAIQTHLDTFGYDNHEGLADALAGEDHDA